MRQGRQAGVESYSKYCTARKCQVARERGREVGGREDRTDGQTDGRIESGELGYIRYDDGCMRVYS